MSVFFVSERLLFSGSSVTVRQTTTASQAATDDVQLHHLSGAFYPDTIGAAVLLLLRVDTLK